MGKLTNEQKIEIYTRRKNGETISQMVKEYQVKKHNIQYLIRLIDFHGTQILRHEKKRYYSPQMKEKIINEVLIDGKSINQTAIKYGLSTDGMLHNWINSYKANGCIMIEKKMGRSPDMIKKKISKKNYQKMTEAENAYLKKLPAVIQNRKNQ